MNNNFSGAYLCLQGKLVLNVDDNDLNQLVIAKILRNVGVHVISAFNGEEAIQKLSDGAKPDFILMDLEMPVMNGFRASEFIRKRINANIPIIINSGLVSGFDKYKLNRLNIHDFLQKPYSMEDIFEKLSKNLPEMQGV